MIVWPPHLLNSVKAQKIRETMAKNIACNITHYRKQRGLTQQELGIILNRKQPHIARWERKSYGRHTLNSLVYIATALDVQVSDLIAPIPEGSNKLGESHDTTL